MNQTSSAPTAKTWAATVAATSATTILVWVLQTWAKVEVPALVQAAIIGLLTGGITFAASYIKTPAQRDTIEGQP